MNGTEPDFQAVERALRRRTFATLSILTAQGRPHATGVVYADPPPPLLPRKELTTLKSVLDGLAEAINADAAAAAVSFDAQATLVGVTEVDVVTGARTFKIDEPEVLGDTDLAANPVQLVLASLGACQAITYQVWAAKLGIALEGVKARVEGDIDLRGFFGLDDTIGPGFTAIRLFVTLRGPEPPARDDELVASVNRHCPVLDIVANPVPVDREVKIA